MIQPTVFNSVFFIIIYIVVQKYKTLCKSISPKIGSALQGHIYVFLANLVIIGWENINVDSPNRKDESQDIKNENILMIRIL